MASRSKALVKRVMEVGEAQIDRVVGQLLANERFVGAVQGVVAGSLAAKGSLDKSLRSALATMNLPSTADVEELGRRLDRMERVLAELDEKLSRLEAPAKATKARTAKPEAPKKKPAARKPAKRAGGEPE
ncbi:MAG TPA: hypothetical protein VN033_00640 [Vulgatibacter sp.]|nr:hypothetical protein [Vulgatibacter sp.]